MKPLKPKSAIQEACLEGVRKAYEKYFLWSGGYSLRHAPESFIQAEIANTLAAVSRYVTLEDGVRGVLIDAGAKVSGRSPGNGRLDIITWWENGTPRKYIEIKKALTNDSITADAKRLRLMMNKGRSARRGMVVIYTAAMAPETLSRRLSNLAASSHTTLLCNLGPQMSGGKGENPWFWDAACFDCFA